MKKGAIILCIWLTAAAVWAQDSGPGPSRDAREAAEILGRARSSDAAETSRQSAENSSNQGRIERATLAIEKETSQLAPSRVERHAADQQVQQLLRQPSEDARPLLAQANKSTPALRHPSSDDAPALHRPTAEDAAKVTPKEKPGSPEEGSKVIINCEGAAYFDSKQSMGVFTDNVTVNHPQFNINCDELEVYMVKEDEKSKAPKPEPPPPANGKPAAQADSSIRQAIATGRRVIIEKKADTGESQVGVCRHATYVGSNGDVIMRDMPQVQRGTSLIRATSPSTYMVITQDGKLHTYGPATTEIIQDKNKKAAPPPLSPSGAPTPTLGGPAKTN